MIIIDTNVFAELTKREPDAAVAAWVQTFAADDLHFSAVSRAEVQFGLERLPAGARRDRLVAENHAYLAALAHRTHAFGVAAADEFGSVVVARENAGRPIGVADAMIAAIARVHGATIATRNVRDFEQTGVSVVDPWAYTGEA